MKKKYKFSDAQYQLWFEEAQALLADWMQTRDQDTACKIMQMISDGKISYEAKDKQQPAQDKILMSEDE